MNWHKVLTKDELVEGRVKTVSIGTETYCLSHFEGEYTALDNKCPHQGGPLGEGSIEKGYIRCPWHGWEFCPKDGKSPGAHDDGIDMFPVEVRDDGVYIGLEDEPERETTISDVMMETMTNWGVKHVWGIVGHSNLGVADGIRVQETKGNLKFYGVRHENSAAFAASAYGKLTGRPAACFGIAGPGSTNMITGLWDANVDRSPVLALCGQVDTQVVGPGAFQEVDLLKAFGNVALWSQSVLHESKHVELMNLACKKAIIGRGVTQLVFPDEVQGAPAPEGLKAGGPEGRIASLEIRPSEDQLAAAIALIKKSKRPTIIVGHGARFHMDGIIKLAETLKCCVLTTFKGKGVMPDTHPLAGGVLGRSGTPIASYFMNESDCLIVLGASFSNHTGITPKKPTIQIDMDADALGRFHKIDVPVWGEIGVTTALISDGLGSVETEDRVAEIAERWAIWRKEKESRRRDDFGHGVDSASIFDSLTRLVPDDAILPVDVGNNTYSFGRYFETKNNAVLMSGYLGSIGFGLPAAMGAWAATQEDDPKFKGRKVVSVSGDGGFGQSMMEVMTCVKYNMNITHILLNNCEFGKISKEQRAAHWDVWATDLTNCNFSEYVTSTGGLGIRVTKKEDLDAAIQKALAHDGFSLVEVMTDVSLI